MRSTDPRSRYERRLRTSTVGVRLMDDPLPDDACCPTRCAAEECSMRGHYSLREVAEIERAGFEDRPLCDEHADDRETYLELKYDHLKADARDAARAEEERAAQRHDPHEPY